MLYAAARDNRLIWQGTDGFALLEPPLVRPRAPRWWGLRHALADRADRNWSTVVLSAPPLLAFLCVLALLPFRALWWTAIILLFIVVIYVAAFLTVALLRPLFSRRPRGPAPVQLQLLSGEHWTMTLFHQVNPARIDELFDRVRERLRELLIAETATFGRLTGTEVTEARVSKSLVCRHDGITTSTARERIAARHGGPAGHDGFSISPFEAHPDDAERTPGRPIAFVRLYFFGLTAVLLMLAQTLSSEERGACAQVTCTRAASSYWDALTWIGYEVVWRQPPHTDPVTGWAVVLGWVLTPLLPLTVLVSLTAALRHWRYLDAIRPDKGGTHVHTRLLIVTVTETERDAVITAFEDYVRADATPSFTHKVPKIRLGEIAGTEIFLIQAAIAGAIGAATVSSVVADAIRDLKPHCAIIAGICYGLKPAEQKLGDVLVSSVIRDLDYGKFEEVAGNLRLRDRGERVAPSPALHLASLAAQRGWQLESGIRVRFGEMLSWNKVINSGLVVEALRERYPDAIGGDMEGSAFHAAVRWAGIEGIVIKSICDWAESKSDEFHETAAANSARFVLHLVKIGALGSARRAPA
ncbi:5'-methylthioadenosine/S-adenosylhomocysteine nucleosidase family protein [Amycolatopsis sp. NBC_00438]|uniref:5'-methylthioadenosine/S-adenosylhomocysteine nucleosidase family protein n=1 Tax=Amycolatopsis sp. NBC_00438 TaxID=2903558 RepID=UPI002E23B991